MRRTMQRLSCLLRIPGEDSTMCLTLIPPLHNPSKLAQVEPRTLERRGTCRWLWEVVGPEGTKTLLGQ